MRKVSSVLPANRTAALATFISGLAGCGTALAGVWPSGVTNEIALIAGGAATLAGPLAHIVGSIAWDRTPAGQAQGFTRRAQTVGNSDAAQAQARADEYEAMVEAVRSVLKEPAASAPETDPQPPAAA